MNTLIESFSENEYLIIFSAFIYGHIIAVFFSGWGDWIKNRKSILITTDHLLLSVLILLLIIDIWWVSYARIASITYGLSYFFVSLLTPINMYILATILFPDITAPANRDLVTYFHKKERVLYALLAANFALNLAEVPFLEKGVDTLQENYFRIGAFVICGIAIVFPRRFLTRALMGSGFLLLITHMIVIPQPTPSATANLSFVEYLTIFTTFIYGYVASVFFRGWSTLIQRFRKESFNTEHLAWSILGFCYLIDVWWGSWEREAFISTHLGNFILSITTPLAFYFLANALFPAYRSGAFEWNRMHVCALFGVVVLNNLIVANLMEEQVLFSNENLFRLTAILLMGIVLKFRSVIVSRVILISGCVLLVVHTILYG